MSYKVKLQAFEGPFDLLVYLIENAQMSIYDIKISQITNQYLAYIKTMKEMDVNLATEFMVLASSLIEIKSKMILPRTTLDGKLLEEDDPRTDLVARLLEYKKFKSAAESLQNQEELCLSIFEKPQEDISVYLEQPDEYLSLDLRQFANAFSLFIMKKQKVEEVRKHYTRVERERSSLEQRMNYIVNIVRKKIGSIFNFRELIPDKKDKYDVVISFISLLEMAKSRIIKVEQQAVYGDITVCAGECVEQTPVSDEPGDKITGIVKGEAI